jgi:hypothetical protein
MRAEGLLARMLEARGHRTKSDVKRKADLRRQLRQLRQLRKDDRAIRAKTRGG